MAQRLRQARKLAVLTGAGVSRESGIPTFRDAQTGLWASYDPARLATPQGFLADPPLVWRWYDMRRAIVLDAQPNPGHLALSEMEEMIPSVVIITQNIDGLHARAGSRDIIELHGNIARYKCFENEHPQADVQPGLGEPPRCSCGSLLRPDVVWFGENLPPAALERAFSEIRSAQVALVVGTSGLVQPAASLPFIARHHGAYLVEVNPEETATTIIADCFLQGRSGEILPRIVEAMRDLKV